MRKFLLATAATLAIATPAAARDNSAYVGIEGGVWLPKDQDADVDVDFTTFQQPNIPGPTVPAVPAGPADTEFGNFFGVDYKTGLDIDLIAGYDFGMFRVEGELGWKRAKFDEFEVDDTDLAALNVALNRPDRDALDPAVPAQPVGTLGPLTADDFDIDGRVRVLSAMVNGMVDFGGDTGFGAYVGAGFGRAWVSAFDDTDSNWAWQIIAGVRTAISSNIDIGLKYRFFNSGTLDLESERIGFTGNAERFILPNPTTGAPTPVDRFVAATLDTDWEQKLRSHSLLLSLIFNFGAVELPPPPPPPVVPAAPPPPATTTCPDGTVVLAGNPCPPPPPPPPPPPVERGERG